MTPTPLQQTLCNGLLYGLKVKDIYDDDIYVVDTIRVHSVEEQNLYETSLKINGYWMNSDDFKPILFSLDMLDKEIEINGERFVPTDEFFVMYGGGIKEAKVNWKKDFMDNILYTPFGKLDFDIIQKLIEWHFNVFQLPEGDYIPVTNEFNPYK